ncbi:glutathione S-transferase family protein [Rhodobacter sp. HX-7-19]|uniref:Glutathione S-transferase family protein n=1 Tax=Paragemmobacter kunshanensis TaxID=2583234 RepID=A0A6M1TWY9_9RHOB|nr:glutathione S-transferase family protein [Rhodobacter kunshanensis]NGQ92848.1 glutathione S-transferase family protein [Rhodobacter kunshanensis]
MNQTAPEQLTIWTFDWVPEGPRGYVRDLRLRWACEEAGLSYRVGSVPFEDRGAEHRAMQPFGQVPYLTDGDVSLFESGACLLHLSEKSETLMPRERALRAETLSWVLAALNSVEMVSVPWWFVGLSSPPENPLEGWLRARLTVLEDVLTARDWLVDDRFTAADLIMADVLRPPWIRAIGDYPATEAYINRICARPAFAKAHADQIAHFSRADETREA